MGQFEDFQPVDRAPPVDSAHLLPLQAKQVPDISPSCRTVAKQREEEFFGSSNAFSFSQFGNIYGKSDVLAQAPKDDLLTKLKNKFEHPGRNNPDAGVDYAAANDAYQRFGLEKYGVDKNLIGAVLRNEQYWLNANDVGQDYLTEHRPFMMPLKESWTVGPSQMQLQIMENLVSKYQDKLPEFKLPAKQVITVGGTKMGERPADVAMLSLNKENAALLAGAYFADVIEKLEKQKPPCGYGASDAANKVILKLWNSGKPDSRQEALIRSFNPEEGEKHLKNVLNHLAKIKKSGH